MSKGLGGILGTAAGGIGGFLLGGPVGAIAGAGLGGSIGGGFDQASAATDAANTQANSANQANQLQYQMFQEQQKLMQPWVQSGEQNLNRLNTAVAPGGTLDPGYRFSTQDWQNSPEYAVYNNARDAALTRSQDALMAQGAASGMYGSGTMANALSQNMGQLYAQYDPQSLAAARQAAEAARTQEFNMLAGLSSSTGAQQVAQYAGQYGQNAGANMIGAGNAQAAGQVGSANAWGNAMSSGVNQLSNAYGQYQGQQNFNQMLPYLNTQYNQQGYGAPYQQPYQDPGYGSHQFTPSSGGYYQT